MGVPEKKRKKEQSIIEEIMAKIWQVGWEILF